MDQNAVRKMQALLMTDQGKALMKLMSADGGKSLMAAGAALKSGDSQKAKEIMAPLLSGQEAQELLSRMEKSMQDG